MRKLPLAIWGFLLILILLKLWLVAAQPLWVNTHSTHDDQLFLKLAQNFLKGEWLGTYDNLSLAKGPLYPAFIAMSFILGIPLLLSEHLVYIGACVLFVLAVLPLLKRPIYPLILCTILLFNPASYEFSAFRVIRESFYSSLTLLTLACAIGLLLRLEEQWQEVWGWAAGMGISLAAFWLTREEGSWLFPALCLILASAIYKIWRVKPDDWKSKISLWLGSLAIPVFLIILVSSLNFYYYGLFSKTEFDSQVFRTAYGSLVRVRAGETIPYVPVSRKMRKNIYDVSPTFAELRPYFEGPAGEDWTRSGDKTHENRGEIEGGWFMWAFREAITQAGYYSSGKFPADFYQRMTREINLACDAHLLKCSPVRSSLMPPLESTYIKPLAKYLLLSLVYLTRFQGVSLECPPTTVEEDNSWIFIDLTREEVCKSNNQIEINGWVFYEDGPIDLVVKGDTGEKTRSIIERKTYSGTKIEMLSTLGTTISEADVEGFSIVSQCPFGCKLELSHKGVLQASLSFNALSNQYLFEQGKLHLFIDKITIRSLLPEQMKLNALKLSFLHGIVGIYQSANLPLMLISLFGYIYLSIKLIMRRRQDLWVVISILLVVAASRILLITLISATSFYALSVAYLAPAYPMMLSFMFLILIGSLDDILAIQIQRTKMGTKI